MTWAQRLKRVFNIDIEVCNKHGVFIKLAIFYTTLLMKKKQKLTSDK